MKTIECRQGIVCVSQDVCGEFLEGKKDETFFPEWVGRQTRDMNTFYRKYFSLWGKLNDLKGLAILLAHGTDQGGKWNYLDGKHPPRNFQTWVNKNDYSFSGLSLCGCSPSYSFSNKKLPKTEKSILMVSNGQVSSILEDGLGNYDLILPDGKIITPYTIESDLEDLDWELNKRAKLSK